MKFPLPASPDIPALEESIQAVWRREGLLRKYLRRNITQRRRFSFLDGPITANNPMGVHHAWGRTMKDAVQRFFTMRGFRQRYQNGFDAQGLWVEVEVERELGLKTKKDIESLVPGDQAASIAKFVERCKARVLKYAKIQTEQSKRLGYFMDWDHSYVTMSEANNYAIWQFLKVCHEKTLIYKGLDSVPWCPRCGTAISQHEILQEEYQEVAHRSLYVALKIVGGKFDEVKLLVWTTTPWTLPVNVSVAVDPNSSYIVASVKGTDYIVMEERQSVLGKFTIKKKVRGSDLIGIAYAGPFDDLPAVAGVRGAHRTIDGSDVVNSEEGTGLVHIAPGAGAEDYRLGRKHQLPAFSPLDETGTYLEGYGELTGQSSRDVSRLVETQLESGGWLFRAESITHRYPTCWRCKTELVFRLVDEWYIKMDPIREELKAAARRVNWWPPFGLSRELDWLTHMGDWLISKKRYWGLALPIYECQACHHFEVIGSREELNTRAAEGFEAFDGHSPHRPWIDAVKIRCEQCGEPTSRIPDVGNPWLDAGIVPFSTFDRPEVSSKLEGPVSAVSYFAHTRYFKEWFPADLVLESFPGQFKNWFYALLVMSTVLEGRPAMRTVLGHGTVQDERGEAMHKSKGNMIEFDEAAGRVGADVMRWLYLRSPIEGNVLFGWNQLEAVRRRFCLILYHSVRFGTELPARQGRASAEHRFLDRWVKSRLNEVVRTVTEAMATYDIRSAAEHLEEFVVTDLSQWYIRRSRGRRDRAFQFTLHATLCQTLILLAPFMPHLADYLSRALGERSSVHLADWPKVTRIDRPIIREMQRVRALASLGHEQRARAGVPLRQVLRAGETSARLRAHATRLLEAELNVDRLERVSKLAQPIVLDTRLDETLRRRGRIRTFIRLIQGARKTAGLRPREMVTASIEVRPTDELLTDPTVQAEIERVCSIVFETKKLHGRTITCRDSRGDKVTITFGRPHRSTAAV